jgi:hypothetical protein
MGSSMDMGLLVIRAEHRSLLQLQPWRRFRTTTGVCDSRYLPHRGSFGGYFQAPNTFAFTVSDLFLISTMCRLRSFKFLIEQPCRSFTATMCASNSTTSLAVVYHTDSCSYFECCGPVSVTAPAVGCCGPHNFSNWTIGA